MNPVPGVEKTTPRGELTLKKSGLSRLGASLAAGTPSQLISRRAPVASENNPLAPATTPPPKATRYASRVGVMLTAFGPVPEKTIGAAGATSAIDNATVPAAKSA